MKARLNGTKDPFVEITEVSLANKPHIIYDARRIEFEQEKTHKEPTIDHWQDLRERAAIAALQGLLSAPLIEDFNLNSSVKEITDLSVILANALVKKLKGE